MSTSIELHLTASSDDAQAHVSRRGLSFHYGLTIFLGAFLLFQVQPLLGKLILPWFGGSASVWTTCMLFFQVLLLAGYLYAHAIATHLAPRSQTWVHLGLLGLSLTLLPLTVHEGLAPTGQEDPTLRILLLLGASAGLPYFVLSTTGPLVQAWFARERTGAVPYRLFALSNLGCLIALLGYPVAVEPFLSTRAQSTLWSVCFGAYVVSAALLALRARRLPPMVRPSEPAVAIAPAQRLLWMALSVCPSVLLLAVTSHITANIAPVPLLWIAPLALYLLSFILCFREGGYSRKAWRPVLLVSLFAMALLPSVGDKVPVAIHLAVHLLGLFAACMVCHGELALRQPDSRHLTTYYLMLSVGGAAGGVFVGVLAPYLFNDQYELSVGLVATAGLVWSLAAREDALGHTSGQARSRVLDTVFLIVLLTSLGGFRLAYHWKEHGGTERVARNFYGVVKVSHGTDQGDAFRYLTHGGIIHGLQFTDASQRRTATTYYSRESGIGRTFGAVRGDDPLRVGVVGMGVGTLLTYSRPGDYFRLYEIDPLVVDIARSAFTFLSDSAARQDIVIGDARLQLSHEPSQQMDVLVIDAFSGDSIPVHLLTREAFSEYLRHLKPRGVLAVHVSNRYLRLEQVVQAAADDARYPARRIVENTDLTRRVFGSQWVLVTRDDSFFQKPGIAEVATPMPATPGAAPWRDDYSSVLKQMRWRVGQ